MGNFGQVPNYFRGILLSGKLICNGRTNKWKQFSIVAKEIPRACTDISNGNMPFKVPGMASLHSLPLGIVLHPFCGCLVGLHTIQCHWQDLHWQSGGQNWHWQPVDQEWHQTVIQALAIPFTSFSSSEEQELKSIYRLHRDDNVSKCNKEIFCAN